MITKRKSILKCVSCIFHSHLIMFTYHKPKQYYFVEKYFFSFTLLTFTLLFTYKSHEKIHSDQVRSIVLLELYTFYSFYSLRGINRYYFYSFHSSLSKNQANFCYQGRMPFLNMLDASLEFLEF